MIASFEPGEQWFYDYRTGEFIEGSTLAAPHSHPLGQPVPGPADRVPSNCGGIFCTARSADGLEGFYVTT